MIARKLHVKSLDIKLSSRYSLTMSFDPKTLDIKTPGGMTHFEVEAERRREVLARSGPAAKTATEGHRSLLSGLSGWLGGGRIRSRRSATRGDGGDRHPAGAALAGEWTDGSGVPLEPGVGLPRQGRP